MINDKNIELLIERLVERSNKANSYFLKKIGSYLKQIKELKPSQAQKLIQILKYGDSYQQIVKEMSKYSNLNVKEIDKIFESFAKKDQQFAKQFYDYKNVKFIKFDENKPLKNLTRSLANITKKEFANFTNNKVLGYSIKNLDGTTRFLGLKDAYNELLDTALLNVGQGKESFDDALFRTLKQIGQSGLKTVDFESGRHIRLDSMIRMNLQDGLRNLHNEEQKMFGKEFGSDGVEISVHLNPAPDHEFVQGKQFSNEEFDNFQNDKRAISYDGMVFEPEFEGHDRRSISQYNCYHYIFAIILGVSKPNYDEKQLQRIIDQNNQKVEIEEKKYTKYECTQLQRTLERKIRQNKDLYILAKQSENEKLLLESKYNITVLSNKYNEISKISELPTKKDRLRVSGYKR